MMSLAQSLSTSLARIIGRKTLSCATDVSCEKGEAMRHTESKRERLPTLRGRSFKACL